MKKYKKEKYSTEQDWLNSRGFGGSSASAIMGCNPYMTKLDIYCSSTNDIKNEPRGDDNESMQYGRKLEPVIRDIVKYNFESQYRLQTPNGYTMYRSTVYPFMTATLDGILTNKTTKEKWVLEIKTHDLRGEEDREVWRYGIPKNYLYQCLHYLAVLNDFVGAMLVAKLRTINYSTGLVDKEEIAYYYIKREDAVKTIENLINAEVEFYNDNILKRMPPDVAMPLMEGKEEE